MSDRYGRRGIFMLGALLVGIWAFAMFPLMATKSFTNIAILATFLLKETREQSMAPRAAPAADWGA